MPNKKTTPERLAAFSDGVFSVIITIMVLDLKPPAEATLKALLPLWPTALSYAVSYLFVAIIWVTINFCAGMCLFSTRHLTSQPIRASDPLTNRQHAAFGPRT